MRSTNTSLSLLHQAIDGNDAEAWNRLTRIYSPLLNGWLRSVGVRASDAEDLIQEVLLVVARHLKDFEHNGRIGAFRSWLRVILANRVKDYWRSRKHQAIAPGGTDWGTRIMMLTDEDSDASREWNLEHDRKVVDQLLGEIRPRFADMTWEAFHRQVFGGQRADQVAAALGMPISSVYVARSRVLSALRIEAKGLVEEDPTV